MYNLITSEVVWQLAGFLGCVQVMVVDDPLPHPLHWTEGNAHSYCTYCTDYKGVRDQTINESSLNCSLALL